MWKDDNERYGNDCIIKDSFVYSGGVLYHTKSYKGSWTLDDPDHHSENMTPEEVHEYLVDNCEELLGSFLREYPDAKADTEVNVVSHIEDYFNSEGLYIDSETIKSMVDYLEERGIYFTVNKED